MDFRKFKREREQQMINKILIDTYLDETSKTSETSKLSLVVLEKCDKIASL